ncbi:hypothetical protein FDA94_21820 [Herbidospora galbida]|uniref:Uncharacterized protein n=1 Tax=Herbidospora galbida TaxID=2575442 RepID=A0A4U3MFE6_9ACTN|nr:hypothetical protein [Herbidospora galbida]TKK86456.1 hypothetical protein FDA94_21820 [Herbidospora galbida]
MFDPMVAIVGSAAACVSFVGWIAVRGFNDRHYVRDTVNEHTARFYRCDHCGELHEYGCPAPNPRCAGHRQRDTEIPS